MKLKIILFTLFLSCGILNAQDTLRSLIISEALVYRADYNYIELTNIGDKPIYMGDFKLGMLGPYSGEYFTGTRETWLPEKTLAPGESYVIATVLDFTEKMHRVDPDNFGQRVTPKELWDLADWQIHKPETNSIPGIDSITPGISTSDFMGVWDGRDGWYLEQHLSESDSVVVDQVNGWFDNDGVNSDQAFPVAGVSEATVNSVLVRRFNVKQGNTTFVYGVGADDSEWIPVPLAMEDESQLPWRTPFWTVGNHGDYNLDENTLISDKLEVDLANKTIAVPWGTRQYDALVKEFDQKPGIGWFYHLSEARDDSAFVSARTGDRLTVYVCGLDVDVETYDIIVSEPSVDANIVIPKYATEDNGFYNDNIRGGNQEEFQVTVGEAVMDSITNGLFGIPYATRVDTLLKYLEKAPKASWEIVWVDDMKRTDVMTGDKLKVTAENGDVKEYYIKVNGYRPNHNAYLSSITWPDIPEWLKDIYGWVGDTIPGFGSTTYNYIVQVPYEVEGIPALVGKAQELNSKVKVTRASSLDGTIEQKTITFTVTAEDDTTINVYTVQLNKETAPENVQPYLAEPFLSELVFQDIWSNGFVEICNPGTEVLDLSNYMFTFTWDDVSGAVTNGSGPDDWGIRYEKYIPGYKWVNEATWAVSPGTVVSDISVSPLVFPGDVFVAGQVTGDWTVGWRIDNGWTGPSYQKQADVLFNTSMNPWNETFDDWNSAAHQWVGANWYLFKILNDSIKAGLKPANDPNDFELIEVFGMGDGTNWNVGGFNNPDANQGTNYIRKPQYTKGKRNFKESFGTTPEDSEWSWYDLAYWQARGVDWAAAFMNCTNDLGKHFFNATTDYMSTVTSPYYRVSDGFSLNESITGIKTGTTANDLLAKIVKKNENQSIKINGLGGMIEGDAILFTNDTLIVTSADTTNITKYVLGVSDEGMSSNAVLTSSRYTIIIEQEPKSAGNENAGIGNVKGFDYGTALRTILANITVPPGASMVIINSEGAYVPLKTLNFDTTSVNVTVNDNIYLDVIAENGVTEIVYQLLPASTENDAFVLSDIYNVRQKELLIEYVPRGTTVSALLSNIVASADATLKVVDKIGHQRMDGNINDDDKVVVTSSNGAVSRAYYMAMLAEEYIPEPTYLAYILSNDYAIDQVIYKVDGVTGDETISAFLSKVTPASGATAMVVDKDGMDKLTGDIDKEDRVKVTSADGKINVYYTFGQLTNTNAFDSNKIELYPNPSNGLISVSGVKAGQLIQVYNLMGVIIRNINVKNSIERISLSNQPAGMYIITVNDNNKMLIRFKALKK